MLKSEMIAKNPLRALDQSSEGGLVPGQMGLVAARAGTGKTAFLIQVALDNLFRGNPVLHVSVGETVSHVKSWYEEIFRDLAVGYDLEKTREVWREAEENRLIMTFRVDVFSPDKLAERLDDLVEQGIFAPRVVLIDGLELSAATGPIMAGLGHFAEERNLKIWVASRTHRDAGDVATLLAPAEDFFQLMLGLEPQADSTVLRVFKNASGSEGQQPISLDTRTLLLVAGD